MKTLHILSIATLAMAGVAANAQLDTRVPVRVVIDGSLMQFPDQQPIQSNGRVFVPLRGVFERLGAEVDWDAPNQTVTAYKRGVRVTLAIGRNDASVNEHNVHMDSPARIVGGSTMVPLRFVSEALGAEVSWNDATLEVDISQANSEAILEARNAQATTEIYGRDPQGNPLRPVQIAANVINVNTVLPWEINSRLTSNGSQEGDIFTATIVTGDSADYLGIPAGTKLYGRVAYVQPREGGDPGVVELRFERIVMPNGRHLVVAGQLISLDDESVVTSERGRITARRKTPENRVMYAGYGDGGAGIIVGLRSSERIRNSAVLGMVDSALSPAQRQLETKNVDLARGSHFGLRLSMSIVLPDDGK